MVGMINRLQILTKRAAIKGYKKGACGPWDVIFEWEDVLSSILKMPLRNHFTCFRSVGALCYRMPFLAPIFKPRRLCFSYNIYSWDIFRANYKSIIPCIIDFYLTQDREFDEFYRSYDKCPLVLISSREAYEVLRKRNCPLKIAHLGLSISDKYSLSDVNFDAKDIDAAVVGRTSKVLLDYCKRYADDHPEFCYVYKDAGGGYVDNKGRFVAKAENRAGYMSLLRRVKVGLYSTPGIDGDRRVVYNQVTPRFLEYIVSGCHVLARYSTNPDTDFYEMSSIAPHITSYEHFEATMDWALSTNVDVECYNKYLCKHYTSARAMELAQILMENGL